VEGPVDTTPPEPFDPRHAAVIRAQRAVWENLSRGFRRPWMTVSILGVISVAHVLAGIIQLVKGQANLAGVLVASRPTSILVYLGAMYNQRVSDGEIWRLVSCLFLHGDGMHLLLNGLALYGLGRLCESVYGPVRFLWLFLVAGICGSTLSWLGGNVASVGASGSIFGLMGACIVFGYRYRLVLPPHIGDMFRKKLLPWVGLNLMIGVMIPFIDNLGHVGGLIGGAVMALVISNRVIPSEPNAKASRVAMGVASGVLLLSTVAGVFVSWVM
jgi:rhomboid protease GluP